MENELPLPEQFYIDKPPFIRAAMMQRAVSEIDSDFTKKFRLIIDDVMANSRMDSCDATIFAINQIKKKLDPYRKYADRITAPFYVTLNNALGLEKSGQIEAAIILY